jgi:hypothetical protein
MLIRYFRKLQSLTPLLLFIIGAALWSESLLNPEPVFYIIPLNAGPFYLYLQPAFALNPTASWMGAYLFLFVQAILLNHTVTSQGILEKYSFLTSLIYVMLMSSFSGALYMHPLLFSNFFILLAVKKIFQTYDEEIVLVEVFNVGMLISIAGLFYYPAWLFFILLIISLFIFYIIELRSFLAASIGFIMPLFFLALYLFLTDSLREQFFEFPLHVAFPDFSFGNKSGLTKIFAVFLAGITVLAVIHLIFIHLPDKPIRLRKRLWVLFYFLITSLTTVFFVPVFEVVHISLLFLPISVILAGFFHQIDRTTIAEVLFTALMGLIIAGKIQNLYFL